MDKLDIGERVLSKGDGLIETLLKTVGDIKSGDDDVLKSLIEVITALHNEFEVGATSNNDTFDVRSVICDEILGCKLTALDNIEMTLLFSETSKPHGGLTTTTMLLGQLNRHTLNDFFVVTLEGGEHYTSTIKDNETKLFIVL